MVTPVCTPDDYDAALSRIDALMGVAPATPESVELDLLVDMVMLYEAKYEPMGHPTALAAIEFRMDQSG